jgi:hypothetical protein
VSAVIDRSESATSSSPYSEYNQRLQARREEVVRQSLRERQVGYAKLGVFLLTLILGWLAFAIHYFSPWWLVLPVLVFGVLLFHHEKVTRDWYRAGRAVSFYRWGLTRLNNEWRGKGQPGTRFLDENHPYAADLDLFGPGSLFELLCSARTRTGENTLAHWLLATAGAEEVCGRQQAVAELRPMLDLREELALLGDDVPVGVDFDAVAAWGAEPPILTEQWPRWLALAVGLCSVTTLLGWWVADWPLIIAAVSALLGAALAGWLMERTQRVLQSVEKRGRDLALLARVLACLEKPTFTTRRLQDLQGRLTSGNVLPSQQIAQLGNLLDLLNARRNQLFMPLALLLLWGTQMSFAIERWRARAGKGIAGWLQVIGEFEALCGLAAYAYENPDHPFAEIVTDEVCYDGEGLAHPLLPLPRERRIRNDLKLVLPLRLMIVSGSNMSGKSTYLRTAGINAVLALAGAPVMARRLRLSPLVLGATLRVQDSLQEGRSRFYAELLRVRQVVELSRGPVPLFFLLDEIFAGTNSHDRRQGAEAVVASLIEAGAIGLITTHDLTLTHIADPLGERAVNVHFADHLENGEMLFNYQLQSGVVRNSNAIALMRAVGLKV